MDADRLASRKRDLPWIAMETLDATIVNTAIVAAADARGASSSRKAPTD